MKILRNLFLLFVLFMIFLLGFSQIAAVMGANEILERSDSVDGFEANEMVGGLDLYVNQSTSPNQPLGLNGQDTHVGWKIQRYFLLPASVNLDDWTILDPNAKIIVGGFGGPAGPDIKWNKQSFLGIPQLPLISGATAQETVSETGITGFTSRSVDGITAVDANEIVAYTDAVVVVDTDFDSFNATTSVAAITANYTVPDNDVDSGVTYDAGDDKSIDEYGTELAQADNEQFYNTVNASIVAFAFENFEDLQNVVMTMDQESSNAPGQPAFNVKRSRIWMHSKKVVESGNNFVGTQTKKVTDSSVFSKITSAPSTLAGIPNNAKQFFTKSINPGHFLASKLGLSGTAATWVGRIGAGIGILIFIGSIVLIVVLIKNRKKFMK